VETIAILAETEAIRVLKARYFRLLDTKDWAGWRQLFTDDVVTETDTAPPQPDGAHRMPKLPGADAFVQRVSTLLGDGVTVHHGYMPEIEVTGPGTARGIWAMADLVAFPNMTLRGYGHYHEEYRKEDGQWRIARLHLTRLRVDVVPVD
jgi:ketosteroid isomerase-like protein